MTDCSPCRAGDHWRCDTSARTDDDEPTYCRCWAETHDGDPGPDPDDEWPDPDEADRAEARTYRRQDYL